MTEPVKCEEDNIELAEWFRREIAQLVAVDKKLITTASNWPTYQQTKLKLLVRWNQISIF